MLSLTAMRARGGSLTNRCLHYRHLNLNEMNPVSWHPNAMDREQSTSMGNTEEAGVSIWRRQFFFLKIYMQHFWVAPTLLPCPRKMSIYVFNNVSRKDVASKTLRAHQGRNWVARPWDMQSNPGKASGDDNYSLEMSSLGFLFSFHFVFLLLLFYCLA